MSLLAAIWNLYLGLLTLVGNTILVLVGIGLCAYATAQQLEPLHDAYLDVGLFVGGILLISSSTIRRIVWTCAGLAVVWGGVVWFGARTLAEHDGSFEISPELIVIAALPPVLMTLLLEAIRKPTINETDLEITLSGSPDSDS